MNNFDVLNNIVVKDFMGATYHYRKKPLYYEHNRVYDIEFQLIVKGTSSIIYDGKTIELQEGDGVFIPIGKKYTALHSQPATRFVVYFTANDLPEFNDFLYFHIDNMKYITPYLDSFKNLYFSGTQNKRIVLLSVFYNLLFNLMTNSGPHNHPALSKAINYMQENLSNYTLSSTQISLASGYSEGHLRRLFKELYSVTPMQYLNDLRIEHSKNLILGTDFSIKEISELCGFTSPFYFSKIFKAKNGCSPSGFRDQNKIHL